jgi:hypothetical protein
MKKINDFISQLSFKSVIIRMLIGAAIGLAIISLFIFQIDDPNPEWGKCWRVKPLIITPLVAAFGFLSFYLKHYINPKTDSGKIVVFLISTFVFVVALWLGIVLGLDGTLWN